LISKEGEREREDEEEKRGREGGKKKGVRRK
jgi:hypothetical protein